VDPIDEASAEKRDEGVKTLGSRAVVGRVVVRLDSKQHLVQIQLKIKYNE
jgi:hypothetical protein